MKAYKLFVLLNFIAFSAICQDIIILKNNSDSIKCRIIEDKITYLRYTLANTNDTTIYEIKQSDYDYFIDKPDEFKVVDKEGKKVPENNKPIKNGLHADFGLGIGLDYGGLFGVKFTILPIEYLSLFCSFGYQFISPGVNFGVQIHIIPYNSENAVRPHLKTMYGTNSIIIMNGAPQLNKTYMGFTPGVGVEFRFGHEKRKGFDVDLCMPIRSDEFNTDFNQIKNNPIYTISSPTLLTISVGYHSEF